MKLRAFAFTLCFLLCLSVAGETKTVFFEEKDSDIPRELVVEVEAGQVIEILGYTDDCCITWEIDFGNGAVSSDRDDPPVQILAGPLQLKVKFDNSRFLVTYKISQNTPLPIKASPNLQKLSLEGPNLTTEYLVTPGFVYSLSSSSDLLVWEKLSDHSSKDGKLTITHSKPDSSGEKGFFKLQ